MYLLCMYFINQSMKQAEIKFINKRMNIREHVKRINLHILTEMYAMGGREPPQNSKLLYLNKSPH